MLDAVPSLPNLMRPNDCRDLILIRPPARHIRSKSKPNTPLTRSAPRCVLRIRPQRFAHQAFLSRLLERHARDRADVVQRDTVFREEAAVNDEEPLHALVQGRIGRVRRGVDARRGRGGDERRERDCGRVERPSTSTMYEMRGRRETHER